MNYVTSVTGGEIVEKSLFERKCDEARGNPGWVETEEEIAAFDKSKTRREREESLIELQSGSEYPLIADELAECLKAWHRREDAIRKHIADVFPTKPVKELLAILDGEA